MHTLESLMLLPVSTRESSVPLPVVLKWCMPVSSLSYQVQRVSDYHRYLNQLLALTSRDHIDYQNIRHSVARAEEVL